MFYLLLNCTYTALRPSLFVILPPPTLSWEVGKNLKEDTGGTADCMIFHIIRCHSQQYKKRCERVVFHGSYCSERLPLHKLLICWYVFVVPLLLHCFILIYKYSHSCSSYSLPHPMEGWAVSEQL